MPRLLKCYGKKCEEKGLKYPKEELIEIGSKRYCKNCAKEKYERDELYKYINFKMNYPFTPQGIRKQIKDYREYYTYGEMLYVLKYFWDIEKNDIRKGTIGIIPYVYDEAKKYYDTQKNVKKVVYEKPEKVYNIKHKEREITEDKINFDFDIDDTFEENDF